MSTPIVQIRNVTKRIGSKTIIDRLTFDVPRGEVFGFLGPNGAGKTTTIRMMVGLISITDGEVIIDGHSITRDFEKAIRHVGAIVENPELYKYLTGYQNLIHFARMAKMVDKSRIDEVVKLVGLESQIHDKVKTYSLGMRQRLGVAQAILHKPSLLILDEPTNGLDPAGIRELRDYLRKLAHEENIAIIVSSHLLSEMELLCDRIAVIQSGKLVDVRSINEFKQNGNILSIAFEVNDAAEAKSIIANLNAGLEVNTIGERLETNLNREQIADVNAALVVAGIKVYGITVLTKTLEDKFLEVTGGEQVV